MPVTYRPFILTGLVLRMRLENIDAVSIKYYYRVVLLKAALGFIHQLLV